MGQSAIQAVQNVNISFGVPKSQIEITPMIGRNEVTSLVLFSLFPPLFLFLPFFFSLSFLFPSFPPSLPPPPHSHMFFHRSPLWLMWTLSPTGPNLTASLVIIFGPLIATPLVLNLRCPPLVVRFRALAIWRISRDI